MTPLVIITGPTAAGKTALSIELAGELNGEIVNADSMQVYKRMDIGSAKIREDEMQGVRHHLIDIIDPTEPFSVYDFKALAKNAVEEISSRGRLPILTGGTGFYIQALLKDVDFSEEQVDDGYRQRLEELAAEGGPESIHRLLEQVDPEAAAQIHANNVKRVMRALEFNHVSGEKISEHNARQMEKKPAYNYAYFVLTRGRDEIYKRIDERVDGMMREGLLKETEMLRDEGLKPEMTAAHGLGYRELLSYLNGKYDLDEAVRLIKQNTRHYAKRQLTWFRREPDVIWLDASVNDRKKMLMDIKEILMNRQIVPVV